MTTILVTPTYAIDDHGNKYKVINWNGADCAIEEDAYCDHSQFRQGKRETHLTNKFMERLEQHENF